jgi:hypothetical protein
MKSSLLPQGAIDNKGRRIATLHGSTDRDGANEASSSAISPAMESPTLSLPTSALCIFKNEMASNPASHRFGN